VVLDLAPTRIADQTPPDLPRRRPATIRVATYVGGVLCGALTLVALYPIASGAPWRAVGTTFTSIPAGSLAALVALWALGLLSHTVTLTAALPGLSHRRALTLSLTGSAVANVLPLGGAAGVALNYRMARRWGFTPTAFASFTVVTNLWDVLVKLFLPLLVVPLLLSGLPIGPGFTHLVAATVLALPVFGAVVAVLIAHPRTLGRFGVRVERVRSAVAGTVAASWRRLTLGMAVYTSLLFVLLTLCLAGTGAQVPLDIVLLGFCTERLATLAGLTPGGLGLVEVGLAGALMLAPGADAAGVATGALLYRALTFGLEIPIGGLLLAAWAWRQRAAR
jgi:uncharacterized membrane protein YbhN (UPF0104 family)